MSQMPFICKSKSEDCISPLIFDNVIDKNKLGSFYLRTPYTVSAASGRSTQIDWPSGFRTAKNNNYIWRMQFVLLWSSRLVHPSHTSTFRKRLKSVLFDHAYRRLLLALLDVSYSSALQISC